MTTAPQVSDPVATPLVALDSSVVHSMVTSAGTLNDGGVVSSIVNVAVVETELFEGSVAVKVTLAEPVTPQPSLKVVKSFVHTTLQASVAIAPP